MSHTPGPWHWHDETRGLTLAGGPAGETILICKAWPGPPDRALIAAAPELRAACEATANALAQALDRIQTLVAETGEPAGIVTQQLWDHGARQERAARAALALAKEE